MRCQFVNQAIDLSASFRELYGIGQAREFWDAAGLDERPRSQSDMPTTTYPHSDAGDSGDAG
jgi:hypothetical protein